MQITKTATKMWLFQLDVTDGCLHFSAQNFPATIICAHIYRFVHIILDL